MTARMDNPAGFLPDAVEGIQSLIKAAHSADVPPATMGLAHLRASQINGCSPCVHGGALGAKKAGESDERLFLVAAWRETDLFTDAERAALALSEAMTRLSDRSDPVPDEVWDEAARHYDERQLAGLVLWISMANLFNRINAATKQPAGSTW